MSKPFLVKIEDKTWKYVVVNAADRNEAISKTTSLISDELIDMQKSIHCETSVQVLYKANEQDLTCFPEYE